MKMKEDGPQQNRARGRMFEWRMRRVKWPRMECTGRSRQGYFWYGHL